MTLDKLLVVAAALFCCGLYIVMTRRNAVAVLMGVELILKRRQPQLRRLLPLPLPGDGGADLRRLCDRPGGRRGGGRTGHLLRMFATTGTVEVDLADRMRG